MKNFEVQGIPQLNHRDSRHRFWKTVFGQSPILSKGQIDVNRLCSIFGYYAYDYIMMLMITSSELSSSLTAYRCVINQITHA